MATCTCLGTSKVTIKFSDLVLNFLECIHEVGKVWLIIDVGLFVF